MPARTAFRGAVHPVTRVVDEICEIFRELGFTRVAGPEAETERYNFTALNFPPGHPALDLHDTMYLGPGTLLRTHTSPVQVRVMEAYPPPIRVTIPGLCYRRDAWDASHAPVFAQVEGLVVDEGVSFVDLKARHRLLRPPLLRARHVKVRFRPSFFPFTEPSAEVDVECQICGGTRLPRLQGHGLDGDHGGRDGGPRGLRGLRRGPRAVHRLRLRDGAGAHRDAALRPDRHPDALRRRHAPARAVRGGPVNVSLRWLERPAGHAARAAEVRDRLAMLGAPVDAMEAAPRRRSSDVVVGEVLEVVRHPNADRLSLCKVNAGGPAL